MTDWFSIQLLATHLHQGKAFFPPVGEFNYMGYGQGGGKSIVKGLFHHSSQSGCLRILSAGQTENIKIKDD